MIKFISWRDFSRLSHCWVHIPFHILAPCYFFAVIGVFFYYDVKFVFAIHEKPKFSGGTFYSWNRLPKLGEDILLPAVRDRVYAFKFR